MIMLSRVRLGSLIATIISLSMASLGWTETRLTVPPGFIVEQLNFSVPDARQMALSENGMLIVGTRRKGRVYAIPNALTAPEPKVITLLKGLQMPSGVAIHNGDLYIGAVSEIIRVADIDSVATADWVAMEIITDDLPDERHHGWKYLKFGPDDQLYVPVGAPCNICLSDDRRFASLLRMNPRSGATEFAAEGLRNTVGFAWHPTTQDLWVSDNGRDMMGDDVPAEEINIIPKGNRETLHFGYPFKHSAPDEGFLSDPKFGNHEQGKNLKIVPPKVRIKAHSAPLGMTFYSSDHFPPIYTNSLFVAEHGSWNRSAKVGYQVSRVFVDESGQTAYEPFITGWLIGEQAWGRPNDVLVTPEGHLLAADDKAGLIYRVRYAAAPKTAFSRNQ